MELTAIKDMRKLYKTIEIEMDKIKTKAELDKHDYDFLSEVYCVFLTKFFAAKNELKRILDRNNEILNNVIGELGFQFFLSNFKQLFTLFSGLSDKILNISELQSEETKENVVHLRKTVRNIKDLYQKLSEASKAPSVTEKDKTTLLKNISDRIKKLEQDIEIKKSIVTEDLKPEEIEEIIQELENFNNLTDDQVSDYIQECLQDNDHDEKKFLGYFFKKIAGREIPQIILEQNQLEDFGVFGDEIIRQLVSQSIKTNNNFLARTYAIHSAHISPLVSQIHESDLNDSDKNKLTEVIERALITFGGCRNETPYIVVRFLLTFLPELQKANFGINPLLFNTEVILGHEEDFQKFVFDILTTVNATLNGTSFEIIDKTNLRTQLEEVVQNYLGISVELDSTSGNDTKLLIPIFNAFFDETVKNLQEIVKRNKVYVSFSEKVKKAMKGKHALCSADFGLVVETISESGCSLEDDEQRDEFLRMIIKNIDELTEPFGSASDEDSIFGFQYERFFDVYVKVCKKFVKPEKISDLLTSIKRQQDFYSLNNESHNNFFGLNGAGLASHKIHSQITSDEILEATFSLKETPASECNLPDDLKKALAITAIGHAVSVKDSFGKSSIKEYCDKTMQQLDADSTNEQEIKETFIKTIELFFDFVEPYADAKMVYKEYNLSKIIEDMGELKFISFIDAILHDPVFQQIPGGVQKPLVCSFLNNKTSLDSDSLEDLKKNFLAHMKNYFGEVVKESIKRFSLEESDIEDEINKLKAVEDKEDSNVTVKTFINEFNALSVKKQKAQKAYDQAAGGDTSAELNKLKKAKEALEKKFEEIKTHNLQEEINKYFAKLIEYERLSFISKIDFDVTVIALEEAESQLDGSNVSDEGKMVADAVAKIIVHSDFNTWSNEQKIANFCLAISVCCLPKPLTYSELSKYKKIFDDNKLDIPTFSQFSSLKIFRACLAEIAARRHILVPKSGLNGLSDVSSHILAPDTFSSCQYIAPDFLGLTGKKSEGIYLSTEFFGFKPDNKGALEKIRFIPFSPDSIRFGASQGYGNLLEYSNHLAGVKSRRMKGAIYARFSGALAFPETIDDFNKLVKQMSVGAAQYNKETFDNVGASFAPKRVVKSLKATTSSVESKLRKYAEILKKSGGDVKQSLSDKQKELAKLKKLKDFIETPNSDLTSDGAVDFDKILAVLTPKEEDPKAKKPAETLIPEGEEDGQVKNKSDVPDKKPLRPPSNAANIATGVTAVAGAGTAGGALLLAANPLIPLIAISTTLAVIILTQIVDVVIKSKNENNERKPETLPKDPNITTPMSAKGHAIGKDKQM